MIALCRKKMAWGALYNSKQGSVWNRAAHPCPRHNSQRNSSRHFRGKTRMLYSNLMSWPMSFPLSVEVVAFLASRMFSSPNLNLSLLATPSDQSQIILIALIWPTSAWRYDPGYMAGATWDIELIRERGRFLGAEAKSAVFKRYLDPWLVRSARSCRLGATRKALVSTVPAGHRSRLDS